MSVEGVSNMRCLVTGASGHLGSYLVKHLVEQGAEVLALVRPQSDLWRLSDLLDPIQIIKVDLSDLSPAKDIILEKPPEVVFHLAWFGVSGNDRDDADQINLNVAGSLNLFEIIRGAGCRNWVGIGSQAEYGIVNGPLIENLPTLPVTAYGVAKLCVGLLTKKLCEISAMRFIWFRLLATYGPKDDDRHLIPTVIHKLLAGEVPALTSGEQEWDYLYVEDAAEAIYQAAVNPVAHGFFNLGSGDAHPIRDIVERIRNMIDPSLALKFGEVPCNPKAMMHLQADISHLREAVCWWPRVSLQEGLQRTVDWYRKKCKKIRGKGLTSSLVNI